MNWGVRGRSPWLLREPGGSVLLAGGCSLKKCAPEPPPRAEPEQVSISSGPLARVVPGALNAPLSHLLRGPGWRRLGLASLPA